MTDYRYTVRKINLTPLAKFGFALGGLAMILPSLICAVIGTQVISILRTFLDEWESSEVDPLGLGVVLEFDFIELLGLGPAQALLIRLDDQSFVMALMVVLGGVIGGGLLIAIIILIVGWGYNLLAALTGGLEVELRM